VRLGAHREDVPRAAVFPQLVKAELVAAGAAEGTFLTTASSAASWEEHFATDHEMRVIGALPTVAKHEHVVSRACGPRVSLSKRTILVIQILLSFIV